jgi:subtilisin family serine protease
MKWKALVLAAALLWVGPAAASEHGEDDRIENQIVVELEPGISIDTIIERYGVTTLESIPQWNIWRLLTPDGEVDPILDLMKHDEEIARAEPHRNLETPEGTKRSMSDLDLAITAHMFHNQIALETVNVAQAHDSYTGHRVRIAILDTGISIDHPEIAEQIVELGTDFAGGNGTGVAQANGIDDDGDGLIDESADHGTFVAGIISLVAPEAQLIPVRVLEADGKGTSFAVAKGILYAIGSGADVINLSLAMAHDSRVVERAIEDAKDAGIVVVAASGNRDVEVVDFPANLGETVAVAAVDAGKVRVQFSSYGPEIDVSAQGNELVSTLTGDGFAHWEGTSFAAPFVTGAVALLLQKYPGLALDEIRQLLQQTAQPDNNGPELDGLMGAGVVDVEALTEVLTLDRTSLQVVATPQGEVVTWSPVLDASSYDVARGDLASLRRVSNAGADTIDLGPLMCIADDSVDTSSLPFPDVELPNVGEVFFYLFRDNAPDAVARAYGADGDGHFRFGNASDCSVVDGPN